MFGKDGHALDAILGDADYYGTAFHHPQYVRANWSQYFDVLDVVPAAIGNHQDLVILRNTRETDRARSAASHTAGSST